MKRQYDIYGLGGALVDTEITLSDEDLRDMQIEKGVMSLVDEVRLSDLHGKLHHHLVASKRASGGSAANTIIGASYFGCKNFYSCKVANDDNGNFYLSDMRSAGVQMPAHFTPSHGITGKCLVLITPDAERTMNTFLGVSSELAESEIDFNAIALSDFVYIEGYLVASPSSKVAAIKMREAAQANGTKIALSLSDPAIVQFFRDGLLEMIGSRVDLIFCNRDEAIGFTQADDFAQACEKLKSFARSYAITCGAEGAVLYDGNCIAHVTAPKVRAIDSNGAGDMFAGAFLYALSRGESFERAGQFAGHAAAKVVTQYGPRLAIGEHQLLKEDFFD